MNGAQDVGGMMSFGPIEAEPEEPLFHAPWEARVLALTLACDALGAWNIDMMRHARESMHPTVYWSKSYYEIWLLGLLRLLELNGMVATREMSEGFSSRETKSGMRAIGLDQMRQLIARGAPYDRPTPAPPLFEAGEKVRARNLHAIGHTRLPGYVRGKIGVVERWRGGFVFPDSNSRARGENPQHCYTVRFTGAELWGAIGDPNLTVSIDAFEPYLERA